MVFSRASCCDCEEYWDLLEVGPAFIPQLRVEYSRDVGGYWYELLHEIVHGHGMGAYAIFNRTSIIDVWSAWFNGGDFEEPPLYVLTEMDIHLKTGMSCRMKKFFEDRGM